MGGAAVVAGTAVGDAMTAAPSIGGLLPVVDARVDAEAVAIAAAPNSISLRLKLMTESQNLYWRPADYTSITAVGISPCTGFHR